MTRITFALLLLAACGQPPKLELARMEDLGALPLPTGAVARDGVAGARVGSSILLTFGDTFLSAQTENDGSTIRSATAGWASPDKPFQLSEPTTDGGVPHQFILFTSDELTANRADSLNGWALWPLEHFEQRACEALVYVAVIKRSSGGGFDSRGILTAKVTEGSTVAVRQDPLFTPPERAWGAGGMTCSFIVVRE